MSAEACGQRKKRLVGLLLLREIVVFAVVALMLWIVYWLPPSVKESWVLTVTSHPVTWLASNYVHEDWSHLVGNLSGYFFSIIVYIALLLTLYILGYDFRRIDKLSAAIHVSALVVAPLASAAAWLVLASFIVPQLASSKVLGFSASVSAYVGADIALWAIATADAFNVKWRFMYFQLLLILFLLTPASRYPTQKTQWLAPVSPYITYVSAVAATLLAIRKPKYWEKLVTKIRVKEPKKARVAGKAILILLLLCLFVAAYVLDSLNPTILTLYDEEGKARGVVNVAGHLSGTLVGYASTLVASWLLNESKLLRDRLKKLLIKLKLPRRSVETLSYKKPVLDSMQKLKKAAVFQIAFSLLIFAMLSTLPTFLSLQPKEQPYVNIYWILIINIFFTFSFLFFAKGYEYLLLSVKSFAQWRPKDFSDSSKGLETLKKKRKIIFSVIIFGFLKELSLFTELMLFKIALSYAISFLIFMILLVFYIGFIAFLIKLGDVFNVARFQTYGILIIVPLCTQFLPSFFNIMRLLDRIFSINSQYSLTNIIASLFDACVPLIGFFFIHVALWLLVLFEVKSLEEKCSEMTQGSSFSNPHRRLCVDGDPNLYLAQSFPPD